MDLCRSIPAPGCATSGERTEAPFLSRKGDSRSNGQQRLMATSASARMKRWITDSNFHHLVGTVRFLPLRHCARRLRHHSAKDADRLLILRLDLTLLQLGTQRPYPATLSCTWSILQLSRWIARVSLMFE